jgi:hypothetical protein
VTQVTVQSGPAPVAVFSDMNRCHRTGCHGTDQTALERALWANELNDILYVDENDDYGDEPVNEPVSRRRRDRLRRPAA